MAHKQLNERQERFIAARKSGRGQRESAILAGYAKSCAGDRATQLMKNPEIKEKIAKGLREIADDIGFGSMTRVANLRDITKLGMTQFSDNDGNPTMAEASTAVRAIAEVNKMCGDYAPAVTENTTNFRLVDNEALKELVRQREQSY